MPDPIVVQCKQMNCPVATGGACLEGFADFKACPHFAVVPTRPVHEATEVPDGEPIPSGGISLRRGEEFSLEEARQVSSGAGAHMVVLAGAVSTGKSSLINSIYEEFQQGSFAGHLFAGSATLFAFERRAHGQRIASKQDQPRTERTKHTDVRVVHLQVRDEALQGPVRDLLFTDVSGETFRLAKDSVDYCRELTFIQSADHLGLVIDGEALLDSTRRQKVMTDSLNLLRSLLDSGSLKEETCVQAIFTKQDKVPANDRDAGAFQDHVRAEIARRFGGRLKNLSFHYVAAAPTNASVARAHNVPALFLGWLKHRPRPVTIIEDAEEGAREFDRFRAQTKEGDTV